MTKAKLYCKGLRSEAKIVEKITSSEHKKVTSVKRKLFSEDVEPIPYTNEEALAYFMDNGLSQRQYINTRIGAKKRNADIYPSYEKI